MGLESIHFFRTMAGVFRYFLIFPLAWLVGCSSSPPPARQVTKVPEFPTPAAVTPTPPVPRRAEPEAPRIVVAPANPAESSYEFAGTWVSLESWSQTNGLGSVSHAVTKSGNNYYLRASSGTLGISIGSQLAYWKGTQFWLGFGPQLINGRPYLHKLDVRKNVLPLLRPTAGLRAGGIIMIDPGHGGDQPGTHSLVDKHFEKEYTLDWARRLKKILESGGWKVYLTRNGDQDISRSNRVALAEKAKADIFVSLHFNSSPHLEQSGIETYCTTPLGMSSSMTRGYEDDENVFVPNNTFDSLNFQFAMRLHQSLLEATGAVDRGVRRARFMTVLRAQKRPAVLIEGGYLSNAKEAKLIANPAHRQKMAEAVARVLAPN